MNLLTLNTLSSENITSKEEVDELLVQLVYGIKDFLSRKEYKNSRFYTEENDIYNFEIIDGYSFKDAIKSLKREVVDFFSLFLDKQCDSDCLNKMSEDEMENIINSDLYFDDEPFDGQKYMILSYCIEKKTFLLSFGKDRWSKYKVIAQRIKEGGISEKVILDNIANKEHAKTHYNEAKCEMLPQENILYTENFKILYLSDYYATSRDKIIDKIHEASVNGFNIDGFLVKNIQGDIWQIKVGTMGGLQQSAIRILFTKESGKIYILHMFTKQGGNTYDYSPEIETAQANNETLKGINNSEI